MTESKVVLVKSTKRLEDNRNTKDGRQRRSVTFTQQSRQ